MVTIDYTYRDGNNYKQEARAIYSGILTPEQIADIYATLDEGDYFIPGQVGMKELQHKFPSFPSDADHVWHELRENAISVDYEDERYGARPAYDIWAAFMRVKETGWDIDEAMKRLGITIKGESNG